MSLIQGKSELRTLMQAQRDKLSSTQRVAYSNRICEQLIAHVKQNKIKVVHTFLPMGSEPNLYPFIEFLLNNKIQVVCPKTLKDRKLQHLVLSSLEALENGVFGTKYPAGNNEYNSAYDLIIVPGLAFDASNNRLGYGGGYYDTFLAQHPDTEKIGVCYSFQHLEKIPAEDHDISLSKVYY